MSLVHVPITLACRRTGGDEPSDLFDLSPFPQFPLADQRNSGRCWMFASCNLFRCLAHKTLGAQNFVASPAYLLFHDKLERYERNLWYFWHVRSKPHHARYRHFLLNNALEDGGHFDMARDLVAKHGIVPYHAMPDTYHAANTGGMNAYLMNLLRQDFVRLAAASPREAPELVRGMRERVRQALVRFLGEPPTSFTFDFKTTTNEKIVVEKNVTPRALVSKIGFAPGDWVLLAHDPRHPALQTFYLRFIGNVHEKHIRWVNVKAAKDMRDACVKTLRAGFPVWFGCDVGAARDADFMDVGIYDYTQAGLPALGGLDKRARLETYASSPQHAMLIRAYNTARGVWEIENSWERQQRMHMTDAWFDEYVFFTVVHRSAVPARTLAAYTDTEALPIEPWDPLGTLADDAHETSSAPAALKTSSISSSIASSSGVRPEGARSFSSGAPAALDTNALTHET